MKWSKMLIPTMKEEPKDAEATSHKLMLRAGLIRKLSAGVYSYLPLGFRVLQKIIEIVREEINAVGAQEVLLPAIHPVDIWKKTGRYEIMQDILMTIKKDGKQEIVLGPTHEEIITELISGYVSSYKDLPQILYQIQTKFRDEARPRFGVIRSKEFIMKDAYSFDSSWEGLDENYKKMYAAYEKIFSRCSVNCTIVSADSGDMGGDISHEFMVKVPFGEDVIVSCSNCDLSQSLEIAEGKEIDNSSAEPLLQLAEFDTPEIYKINDLVEKYGCEIKKIIKTLIYVADGIPVACLIRGDYEVNEIKFKKALCAKQLYLADDETVMKITNAKVGFAGPVGLECKTIADLSVADITNAVTGANKTNMHIRNVNIERDFNVSKFADIRYIKNGDKCPVCTNGKIRLDRSLEVGHVFKLGTKYSKTLDANFTNAEGKSNDIIMGCYGIGVNRILAACVELNNDEKGIKWPIALAPFKVLILCINQKQEKSVSFADKLYNDLTNKKIEVLYDDRNTRAGIKFKDAELIGVPVVIVVGDRELQAGNVEIKVRENNSSCKIAINEILSKIEELLK